MSIPRARRRRGGFTAGGALLAILCAVTGLLAAPLPAQAASKTPTYYVSLGDSYAVGYQPGLGATPGYMTYVAQKTHLTLANFGCGGATTTSLLMLFLWSARNVSASSSGLSSTNRMTDDFI